MVIVKPYNGVHSNLLDWKHNPNWLISWLVASNFLEYKEKDIYVTFIRNLNEQKEFEK